MQHELYFGKERIETYIKRISVSDTDFINQAIEIYNLGLGKNYISEKQLLNYAGKSDRYILLGSYSSGILVGVMLAYPLDDITANEFNKTFRSNGVNIFLPQYSTGVIKSVAVHPKFRHKGIGTNLTIQAINELKRMSCKLIAAISWDSGRPDSSPRMFEKLEFQNTLSVEDYWYEDSIKEGYNCPNCGNPCHCRAIFYLKGVGDNI